MAEETGSIIYRRPGVVISEFGNDCVLKAGVCVKPAEVLAMELVSKHTKVPIPKPIAYFFKPGRGEILMPLIEGVCLRDAWHDLDVGTKRSICKQIWGFVEEWRCIPKPLELQHLYACSVEGKFGPSSCIVDGTSSLVEMDSDIVSEEALRRRICDNYYNNFGSDYSSFAQANLFDMLPRSDKPSVFSHGDLQPKNIMVSGGKVTGILDWDYAGWYPEYWDFVSVAPRGKDSDWLRLMMACAPQTWDLSGMYKAVSVLA